MNGGILETLLAEVRALHAKVDRLEAAQHRPAMVSVKEYAAARSISAATVRAAIKDGSLSATKYGNAWRVPADVEIGKPIALTTKAEAPGAVADRVLAIVGKAGAR